MNSPLQPSKPSLDTHIIGTYFFMRSGMAILAFAFPLVLWLGGRSIMGIEARESMSAYYHTDMRDVFVGVLCAIGFTLLLYKGFDKWEDWALNAAGVLAFGIAMVPTVANCLPAVPLSDLQALHPNTSAQDLGARWEIVSKQLDRTFDRLLQWNLGLLGRKVPVHGLLAVLFFLAIGYVCGFSSQKTVDLIQDNNWKLLFRWAYRVLGVSMPALSIFVAGLTYFDPNSRNDCSNFTVLRVEWAAIWVFAAFWALKTYEMRRYRTDEKIPDRSVSVPLP